MTDLRSRVEYLRGLSEGLGLDAASKEGKMISEMLQVLGQLAESLCDLASDQEDVEAYLDVVDSDLQDLEDDFYGGPDYTVDDAEEEAGHDRAGEFRGGEAYACPNCGEPVQTSVSGVARYEGQPGSGNQVSIMLTCPRCGTPFHVTQPDTATYIEPEDELTDLPYPTKE